MPITFIKPTIYGIAALIAGIKTLDTKFETLKTTGAKAEPRVAATFESSARKIANAPSSVIDSRAKLPAYFPVLSINIW